MISVTFGKSSAMTTSKIVSATFCLFSPSVCYLHINRITAGLLKASSWFFSPFGCLWFYWGKQFHTWLRPLWLGTILNTISFHHFTYIFLLPFCIFHPFFSLYFSLAIFSSQILSSTVSSVLLKLSFNS